MARSPSRSPNLTLTLTLTVAVALPLPLALPLSLPLPLALALPLALLLPLPLGRWPEWRPLRLGVAPLHLAAGGAADPLPTLALGCTWPCGMNDGGHGDGGSSYLGEQAVAEHGARALLRAELAPRCREIAREIYGDTGRNREM